MKRDNEVDRKKKAYSYSGWLLDLGVVPTAARDECAIVDPLQQILGGVQPLKNLVRSSESKNDRGTVLIPHRC